jgi:hypothetical protein
MKTPAAAEIMDATFWTEKNSAMAIWAPNGNPMPVAIRNGIKSFDAGYNEGLDDRPKEESK